MKPDVVPGPVLSGLHILTPDLLIHTTAHGLGTTFNPHVTVVETETPPLFSCSLPVAKPLCT